MPRFHLSARLPGRIENGLQRLRCNDGKRVQIQDIAIELDLGHIHAPRAINETRFCGHLILAGVVTVVADS